MSKKREIVPDVLFALVLFVLALVPRAWVTHLYAGEPVWDGHYYEFGARRIAAGLGYSDDVMVGGVAVWHPWCHYPVGYSAFLGFFYRILGTRIAVANAVDVTVGALLPVATWLLGTTFLSRGRARFAGVVAALHPGLVLYSALTMSEPLASTLTLFAFWLAARRWKRPVIGLVAGAALLGVSALVRPTALFCAPFLLFAGHRAFVRKGEAGALANAKGLAIGLVVVGVSTLAPVLPWTARNCKVMDGCALVSTNAGWNLAIGAFPRATGRFETLRSADGCREVTGQVQQDRCWLAYGLSHIKNDPLRFLSLAPKKLSYTFDHESFQVEYLHEARPAAWPDEKRARGRELLSNFHRVLVVCAAFGAVAFAPRRRLQVALAMGLALAVYLAVASAEPVFWPFAIVACVLPFVPLPGRPRLAAGLAMAAGLVATTALAHVLFFGEDRYHVVATPALVLLACAAFRRPEKKDRLARA